MNRTVFRTPPPEPLSPVQRVVYRVFEDLQIPFLRLSTPPAVTMEDCVAVDEALDVKTAKSLFLCNRQKTSFYLFVMPGNQPFSTKDFSKAMGISRVSFAPEDIMQEMLQTPVGACTVLSMLLDSSRDITLVIEESVPAEDFYGCPDGTTTNYLKIATADLLEKILPYCHRTPVLLKCSGQSNPE